MIRSAGIANLPSHEKDQIIDLEDVSLQSLGSYMLFDEINSKSSQDFCEFIIKANYFFPKNQVLTIFINSQGGQSYDGFSMIDMMDNSKLEIQTVGVGIIASMASLLISAGTPGRRIISKNAFLMIHQFTTEFQGKYHELVATRTHDDALHEAFIEYFMKRTKMSKKQIKDIFLGSSDKWLTPKEAVKYGICDKIQEPWS